MSLTDALTDTIVHTPAAGTARGTVLVLPGRGDDPAYYRRLASRLAVDGYAVDVLRTAPRSVDDVVHAWARETVGSVRVAIGVDTSAGLLATALAENRIDPAGAILAGTAIAGGRIPERDELTERSACPLHGRLVAETDAGTLASSDIEPTWPTGSAALPVLALHGGADRIAPVSSAAELLTGWNAELVTVAGGLHDVLNDVNHRTVAAEIVAFLERLRLDPSAAPILTRETLR